MFGSIKGNWAMEYLEYGPVYGLSVAKRPSQSEEQAYISRMARTLVGSLGVDEATRCVIRHHWVGLQPLVMAQVGAICQGR